MINNIILTNQTIKIICAWTGKHVIFCIIIKLYYYFCIKNTFVLKLVTKIISSSSFSISNDIISEIYFQTCIINNNGLILYKIFYWSGQMLIIINEWSWGGHLLYIKMSTIRIIFEYDNTNYLVNAGRGAFRGGQWDNCPWRKNCRGDNFVYIYSNTLNSLIQWKKNQILL